MYDIHSLRLIQHLTLTRLGTSYSMASSPVCSCVVISDWSNGTMYKIDMTIEHKLVMNTVQATNSQGPYFMHRWSVGDRPYGVSINVDGHLIVTCPDTRTIKVFTSSGKLIDIVNLPEMPERPWHAVQTISKDFLVSYGKDSEPDSNTFCVVNDKGEMSPLTEERAESLLPHRMLLIGRYGLVFYISAEFDYSWILTPYPLKFRSFISIFKVVWPADVIRK